MKRKNRIGQKQLCSVLLTISLVAGTVMPAFAAETGIPEGEEIGISVSETQTDSDIPSNEKTAVGTQSTEGSAEISGDAETNTDQGQNAGELAPTVGGTDSETSDGQNLTEGNDNSDSGSDENDVSSLDGTGNGADGTNDDGDNAVRNENDPEESGSASSIPGRSETGTLVITSQPQDVSAFDGSTVSFQVEVNESEVTYQWQWSSNGRTWRNCTSAGYDTDTFSFSMREVLSGRYYHCVISSATETVTSDAAMVTLAESTLVITSQPQDVSAFDGSTVSFQVEANESEVTYQWQWSSNGTTWKNCTSAGSDTNTFSFSMKEALAGRHYRCVVSSANETVVSDTAVVTLAEPTLVITSQPQDVSAFDGSTVSFQVEVNESEVTYQWQWSSNGMTWKNCTSAGSNTDTFSFNMKEALSGRHYRCVISSVNETVTSDSAVVTLAEPTLVITSQPQDASAFDGDTVSFEVEVNESEVSYQWQWSSNGTTWKNCTSAGSNTNTFSFSMKEALAGRHYRCVVSSATETVTSDAAIVTLAEHSLAFTAQPQDVRAFDGDTVSFQVEVNESEVSYQWQWSSNGTSWKNCTSAGCNTDTFSFSMKEVLSGRYYRCVVSSADETITSTAAKVTLKTISITIVNQPQDVTVDFGTDTTLQVEAVSADNEAVISYEWEFSEDGGFTWKSAGIRYNPYNESSLLVYSVMEDGFKFRCLVSCGEDSVYSDVATVSISKTPAIIQDPYDLYVSAATVYPGEMGFSIYAYGDDLEYQWQVSADDGASWNNCEGETLSYIDIDDPEAVSGNLYRCNVSNSYGSVTSNAARLNYYAGFYIRTQPQDVTARIGQEVVLQFEAVDENPDAELSYQWLLVNYDEDNNLYYDYMDPEPESAYTSTLIFTASPEFNGQQFGCAVYHSEYGEAYSNVVTLTVLEDMEIAKQPEDYYVLPGDLDPAVFRITAYGSDLAYQWQMSTDNGVNWTDCPDETGTELIVDNPISAVGNLYRCAVSDGEETQLSDSAELVYYTGLYFVSHPENQTVKYGQNATFSVEAVDEASDAALTYSWECGPDSENLSTIEGADSPTLNVTATQENADYIFVCKVKSYHGTIESNAATLNLSKEPVITRQPLNIYALTNHDYNNEYEFSVEAYGDELLYDWQVSSDNGETWRSLTYVPLEDFERLWIDAPEDYNGQLFRCIVSNSYGSDVSNAASLTTYYSGVRITQQPADEVSEPGTNIQFSVVAQDDDPEAELTYQWYSDMPRYIEGYFEYSGWQIMYGETNPVLTIDPYEHEGYETTYNGMRYKCEVTSSVNGTAFSEPAIYMYPPVCANTLQITKHPTGVAVDAGTYGGGEIAFFIVAAEGEEDAGEIHYQWEYSNDNGTTWNTLDGENSPELIVSDREDWAWCTFRCVVSNDVETVISYSAKMIPYWIC